MINELSITGAVIVFIIIFMYFIKSRVDKEKEIKIFNRIFKIKELFVYVPFVLAFIIGVIVNINSGSIREFIQNVFTFVFTAGSGSVVSYDLIIEKVEKYIRGK